MSQLGGAGWGDLYRGRAAMTVDSGALHGSSAQSRESESAARAGDIWQDSPGSRRHATGISYRKARAAARRGEAIEYRVQVKTADGEAPVVDLDQFTVTALNAWRKQQIAERLASGPIWSNPLHHLRHGSASLQLAAGVDIAIVSKRLGHSKIDLTSDTYGHLIGKAGKQATAALVPRRRPA